MENELRIYRTVVRLKPDGCKVEKRIGLIATEATADNETVKKMVTNKIERLFADSSISMTIEIEDLKRFECDFFMTV